MYNKLKKRFWLLWIFIVTVLLILFTKNLDAQDIDRNFYIDSYHTGNMLMMDEIQLAFIFGNEPFEFQDGGFKIITITGDTLYIQIKRK